MKIIWMTWKDISNPLAGGAEVVTNQLASRLAKAGHEIVILTASFPGAAPQEEKNGYTIIRNGGRWSVYWATFRYYRKHLATWPDVIIEEINTIPFFTQLYAGRRKRFLFFHQLCREIWFYQMFFPLNYIGYWLETIYLRLLNRNFVITVSDSTKADLMRFGFRDSLIQIISEGIEIRPAPAIDTIDKYDRPTVLSLGAIRPMKRPLDQLLAFELAKKEIPELQMKIAGGGSGRYYDQFLQRVKSSQYAEDIEYLGRVSDDKKVELMQKCHVITVTSIKEGWGLIVTEANSQGTVAATYNCDGLRDSTRDGTTGVLAKSNDPAGLATAIVTELADKKYYHQLRQAAWEWSKRITFDAAYSQLIDILNESTQG